MAPEPPKPKQYETKPESAWKTATGITWLGIFVVALIIIIYISYVAIVHFTTPQHSTVGI